MKLFTAKLLWFCQLDFSVHRLREISSRKFFGLFHPPALENESDQEIITFFKLFLKNRHSYFGIYFQLALFLCHVHEKSCPNRHQFAFLLRLIGTNVILDKLWKISFCYFWTKSILQVICFSPHKVRLQG